MTDHAGLLRQIRQDARPYVEQLLDLKTVFSGFQKLATEHGLDWGAVKALLKAEVEDERAEDGTKRVDKIIAKADFATAYADMLGLGSANMNENNSISELPPAETARPPADIQGLGPPSEGNGPLPPHDSDGVIIEPETEPAAPASVTVGEGEALATSSPSPIEEPASALSEAEAEQGGVLSGSASSVALPSGEASQSSSSASPQINSEMHREPSNRDVSTDGEPSSAAASQGQAAHAGTGSETLASHEGHTEGEAVCRNVKAHVASPPHSPSCAPSVPVQAAPVEASPLVPPGAPFPDISPFLKRGDPQCAAGRAA